VTVPRGDSAETPDDRGHGPLSAEDDGAVTAGDRSLVEDVEALIEDGKTYLEAEIAYQKTRVAFIADGAKEAIVYVAVSSAFAVLALIGLTVGLIIALSPILTPFGASALVVGLLIACALLAARAAQKRWHALMGAIDLGSAKDRREK
jgi:hypothetical protein